MAYENTTKLTYKETSILKDSLREIRTPPPVVPLPFFLPGDGSAPIVSTHYRASSVAFAQTIGYSV